MRIAVISGPRHLLFIYLVILSVTSSHISVETIAYDALHLLLVDLQYSHLRDQKVMERIFISSQNGVSERGVREPRIVTVVFAFALLIQEVIFGLQVSNGADHHVTEPILLMFQFIIN